MNIAKLSGSPYYSAVLDVPKDVRGVIGRTSFRKSLKTSDKRKALALAHPIVADWKEQIIDARLPAPKSIHDKLQIIQEDIDNISSKMKDPLLSDSEYQKLDNLADVAKDAALDLLVKSKGMKNTEELSKPDEAEVIKSLKKGMTMDKILEKYNVSSELNVKADSALYSLGQNEFVDSFSWTQGASEIVMADERYKFLYVYSVHEPEPKELYEARGLIISDYQKELEKEWIASLREKYPVNVNEQLFLRITADID